MFRLVLAHLAWSDPKEGWGRGGWDVGDLKIGCACGNLLGMKKYRVAEYRRVESDGRDFLFLVADKAVFEADPETIALLREWDSGQEFTREEALASLHGMPHDEGEELFDALLKRRAVLPAIDPRASGPQGFTPPTDIPLKTLILHVAEACNLQCSYCYHAEKGERAQPPRKMSREVAFRAVDFLFERSGGLQDLVLVFFGGEPLLNFEIIKEIAGYARTEAAASGKRISFAITTNGTLLTPEIVDFLQKQDVSITVSLDGSPELHDRYRRFHDDRPSYGVILPRVQHLIDRSRKRPVAARVTVVDEPERVPETLDHLLGLGFVEVGFAPVTTGHPEYRLSEQQMDELLKVFRNLSERFLEAVQEERFFGFSNLIEILVALHQGELMNYPCGAGLGLFSADPEGKLFLCQRFTGEETFCMGDIFNGFDTEKLSRFRRDAEISNKEECRSCWARTICTGGCYHEACVREGSHLKPNLHYCDWIRRWGEIGLDVYCRLAATSPDVLEMLCASRGHPG